MRALDELLKQHAAWPTDESSAGIVVSSRVRLARNVDGSAFPGWAGEEEALRLWNGLVPVLRGLAEMDSPVVLEMNALDAVDREALVERHLISKELAEKGAGSGVVLKRDETISIMVNEEDHLRIQALAPGLDLASLWKLVDKLDSQIENEVDYAVSPQLGYLSACPTNVGTGMRSSVMLHLPGLSLADEIKPIINGISRISMAVRGLWGEGTDAAGNMFQVSNQVTLGESEDTIVGRLDQIVMEIAGHEKNARCRMLQQKENLLCDYAWRARGLLSHARLLDSRETLNLLSHLRLGIDLGIVNEWDRSVIDELFLLIQPGHLQKRAGRAIGAEERDFERARLIRECLVRRRRN